MPKPASGSSAAAARISGRVNQRASEISVGSGLSCSSGSADRVEAEHQRARVGPRLAGHVPQVGDVDADLLGDLADQGLLGRLAGLDEAGQARVAGQRADPAPAPGRVAAEQAGAVLAGHAVVHQHDDGRVGAGPHLGAGLVGPDPAAVTDRGGRAGGRRVRCRACQLASATAVISSPASNEDRMWPTSRMPNGRARSSARLGGSGADHREVRHAGRVDAQEEPLALGRLVRARRAPGGRPATRARPS